MKKVLAFIAVAAIGLSSFAQKASVQPRELNGKVYTITSVLSENPTKPLVSQNAQYVFKKSTTDNPAIIATWDGTESNGFTFAGGFRSVTSMKGSYGNPTPMVYAGSTGNTGYFGLNADSINSFWSGGNPTPKTGSSVSVVNATATSPIVVCDTITSLTIEFYHQFRPFPGPDQANQPLILSVLIRTHDTTSKTWKWDTISSTLKRDIATNVSSPVYHELFNVTNFIKGKDSLQIQFSWKNGSHYYWMIDDVTLRNANAKEIAQTAVFRVKYPYTIIPKGQNVPFTATTTIQNVGTDTLDVALVSQVEGKPANTVSKKLSPLQNQQYENTFYTVDGTEGNYTYYSRVAGNGISSINSDTLSFIVQNLDTNAPYGKDLNYYIGTNKLDPTTMSSSIPATHSFGATFNFFPDQEYKDKYGDNVALYGVQFLPAEGTQAGSYVDIFAGVLSSDGHSLGTYNLSDLGAEAAIKNVNIVKTGTAENPNRSPLLFNISTLSETGLPIGLKLSDTSQMVFGYTVTNGKVVCGVTSRRGTEQEISGIVSYGNSFTHIDPTITPMIRFLTKPARPNPTEPPVDAIGNTDMIVSDIYCYPNPASTDLKVSYTITKNANVNITVSDMYGRTVAAKNEGKMGQGSFLATIPVSDLANGTYVVTVNADNTVKTSKLVIRK